MKSMVFKKLGSDDPDITIGPAPGHDFNTVSLEDSGLLLVTTDPFYVNPVLGLEEATWLGFQIILSDMIVSGVYPRYAIVSLNLPAHMDPADFEVIWSVLDFECKRLGISILSGHTGAYDGCDYPILGSITLVGYQKSKVVPSPKHAREGDSIVLIHGPALEAIATLLRVDETACSSLLGHKYEDAREKAWEMLSIEGPIAMIKAYIETSGKSDDELPVHAMHDVAERGVLGALAELSEATGLGFKVDLDKWEWEDDFASVFTHYFQSLDKAWSSSGQGGLLVVSTPAHAEGLVDFLSGKDIPSVIIGSLLEKGTREHVMNGEANHGVDEVEDPFWPVFQEVLANLGIDPGM